MNTIKRIVRVSLLYITALVLVGSPSLTVHATDPADPPETYSYDKDSGRWNSSKWQYDATTNTYVPVTTAASTPAPATPEADPEPTATAESQAPADASANAADQATTAATGTATTNVDSSQSITNTLQSGASTGNAGVTDNHTAGNAVSGDAEVDATIVNTVHSTIQGDTAGVAHFTADIHGDVTGDIVLYPAIDAANADKSTNITSKTNVNSDSDITNNIDLSAASGDATVSRNTQAGDATSGNAHAVANVLNLINTIIAANKSFIGTINIYGNLNGDILVSPEFIPQLLGSNASSAGSVDTSLSASLDDDQAIINNIKLRAETGQADVSDNTTAGNATTGQADTNLTVLNLTGREVDAKNSLLVFVNVLGKWVGMIVDAPGATAAAIGSGVKTNKTAAHGTVNAATAASITNNLDLTATSGDARVTGNTSGGNATSGNATASANIANISTSSFRLSDWFGVLFINVFGSWIGSFGIDTDAGKVVEIAADPPVTPATLAAPAVRFGFVPAQPAPVAPPIAAPVYQPPRLHPQLTPAQLRLVGAQLPERQQKIEQLAAAPNGSGASNAIMMTVGSLIAGVGAVTSFGGRGSLRRRKE